MDAEVVSKKEQLYLLPQTAAGTPMGQLLRQFWHPIALSSELEPG